MNTTASNFAPHRKAAVPAQPTVVPAQAGTPFPRASRLNEAKPHALMLFVCCLLAACGKEPEPRTPPPPPAPAAADAKLKMPVPPMTNATPQAVASGKALFAKMNCAGCHTYTGKGWMGPDLTDSYWRYGAAPDDIYRSIYEGRPQGMPAWGKALPSDEIWQLVHYIRSLPTHPGGDPTTVSPVTGTGISVDKLPPSHLPEPPK